LVTDGSTLAKFRVDVFVLSSEGLDVLSQLTDFLGPQLAHLRLIPQLLPQRQSLLLILFDLMLPLQEPLLELVFLASRDAHRVLDLREVPRLPLCQLLVLQELFGLLVDLALK
jgi:hypothetical protein